MLLLFAIGVFPACQDQAGPACPEDRKQCPDGECRYCCVDSDCSAGEICCGETGCRECCRDNDCNDDEYCNGQEICSDSGCVVGEPISCDDEISCTIDRCIEASADCENTPDDSLCPPDNRCDPDRGGCVSIGCDFDGDCASGEHCCQDNLCHLCCIDYDCRGAVPDCADDYVACNGARECECACLDEDESCVRDPAACCVDLTCDVFSAECMPACSSDADCRARTDVPNAGDLKCKNGACDFDHCGFDSDCPAGKVCHLGNCIGSFGCADIASCQVEPTSAVVRQGTPVQFSATAYLQDGLVAPGVPFNWTSDDDGIVSVNSSGLATAGAQPGPTTITATVAGCAVSCRANVYNYGEAQAGSTRVMVVDELEGIPIQGADVTLGAQPPATTGADGTVEFTIELSPAAPADITVTRANYHYLTLKAVESPDVIAHLGKIYHLDENDAAVSGGVKGLLDFDKIRCEAGHVCDVNLGIAGLSMPGSLTNIKPRTVLGDNVVTPMNLGGSSVDVPFPEGFVLGLGASWFKQYSTPTGIPGTRAAWATGGKMDLSALIDLLMPAIWSGDEIEYIRIILSLLGDFGSHSAIASDVHISPIPELLDSNDLNGNGLTDDFIPDYDGFPAENMTLYVPIDHSLTITPPRLPVGTYDVVVVLSGVIVRGNGLVPLGISAGLDSISHSDDPDGVIDDPIILHSAEVAGRIPEDACRRVILALAFNIASLASQTSTRLRLAGQVLFVDDFDGARTIPPFMTPADVAYDPAARRLDINQAPAADYFQAIFEDETGKKWNILAENPVSFDLPPAPPEGDRSARADFVSVELVPGVGYQDLPAFNNTNLDDLATLVKAFSYTELR